MGLTVMVFVTYNFKDTIHEEITDKQGLTKMKVFWSTNCNGKKKLRLGGVRLCKDVVLFTVPWHVSYTRLTLPTPSRG